MVNDLLLGAYAMAPAEPTAEEAFYSGVADLDVGGLELPLPLEGAQALDPKWLARNVRRLAGQDAAKGFWSLEDDVAAVLAAGAGRAGLGLSINWGRSAIEGCNARTAVAHVKAAAAAGVLRALVLSGASAVDSPWGPAWADAHIPPRGDDAALEASSSSLLGLDEMVATLRVAGRIPWLAVKVSVRPKDASVATRLAVARAALTQVDGARSLTVGGAGV